MPSKMSRTVLQTTAFLFTSPADLANVQDFALEADEGQMRAGAHLIAGSLSGSLALATGKEPLRAALSQQLRGLLQTRLSLPELDATITVSPVPFKRL